MGNLFARYKSRKRPRPEAWHDPVSKGRPLKSGLVSDHPPRPRWCRGDDLEVLAAPPTGGTTEQRVELTHFARIVDPNYRLDADHNPLVAVQWYCRRYDLVEDAVPEQTGEIIELIESSERALVFDATIIRRITVPPKPQIGEEFFSSSNTRMFCKNSIGATPMDKQIDKTHENTHDTKL